jgi:hypothetical protein
MTSDETFDRQGPKARPISAQAEGLGTRSADRSRNVLIAITTHLSLPAHVTPRVPTRSHAFPRIPTAEAVG